MKIAVGLALCCAAVAQTPKITAVASAASFAVNQVAALGYVSILGSNLAEGTFAASPPYPNKLGTTEVFVCPPSLLIITRDGLTTTTCQSAAVQYASPTQLNVVMPSRTGSNWVIVRVNGKLDADAAATAPGGTQNAAFTVMVQSASPALFLAGRDCPIDSVSSLGGGPRWSGVRQNCGLFPAEPIPAVTGPLVLPSRANRGVITDLQGDLVWSGNPARLGSFYTIWLTGLGKLPASPASDTNLWLEDVPAYGYPRPTIGSVKVTYVGAVPQFPGLYQVNFQVPPSIGMGPLGYGAWPCGNYDWELSLGGLGNFVDFPLIIRNGDVACKP